MHAMGVKYPLLLCSCAPQAVAARRAAAHAQVAALEARVISLALNMGAVLASSETAEREAYNRLAVRPGCSMLCVITAVALY
jgi:hypothetical protein